MKYAGGKGVCYPHLINLMPPHTQYIECYLGGGAVMRKKKTASKQIGIEIDTETCRKWERAGVDNFELIQGDALKILPELKVDKNTLIYADPPYHPETRKRQKVYRHDYSSEDHINLLTTLKNLNCMVIISGYYSKLYADLLKDWNCHSFDAKTHQGMQTEWVWFNFPIPTELHDCRFLGSNFRERETIKRRHNNLKKRISQLPLIEQNALRSWLNESLQHRNTI